MKNLIVISVLFIFASVVKAQQFDYQTKEEISEWQNKLNLDRKRVQDNHIDTIRIYTCHYDSFPTSEPGHLSAEHMYDKDGNTTEFKLYKKNGNVKYHYTYQWNNHGRQIEFTDWKSNGNMRRRVTMAYDSAGNFTDERTYWKKPGNLTWHRVSIYDDKQNLVELKYLGNHDTKNLGGYLYTYYPDGSKKQTIEYSRPGKVLHIWNYDCNPVGEFESKNVKDTNRICVRYETDVNGNPIKIREENLKEGKIRRIVSKYDHRNNLMDETGYDSKDRTKYHNHTVFDENNNEMESISYRGNTGKIKDRNVYRYDASGNLTEVLAYKHSTSPDHVVKFNYVRQQ